jgi:hypothetical protein
MLFPYVSFVLEVVGACLLAVVIVYVAILNRRLSALRADKAHLQQLIVSFNESTSRAEAGIGRMRASAEEAAGLIQTRVGDARQLHEDLAYMVERATGAADRLENAIGTGRAGRSDAGRTDNDDTVAPIRPPNGQMRAAESVEKAGLWRSLKGLR